MILNQTKNALVWLKNLEGGMDVIIDGQRAKSRKTSDYFLGICAFAAAMVVSGCDIGHGVSAADKGEQATGAQLSGGRPVFGPPPGKALFDANCASCHSKQGTNVGGRMALSVAALAGLPPETVFQALVSGKMRDQAAALSREEKKQVAEFLTRRTLVDADATSIKTMKNLCSVQRGLDQSALGWNGWSPAPDGSRFQNAAAASITAAQVPSLKLKWAFGVPQTASMFSQPTVAGGRLFFASDAGTLYSIDAETGCAYWSFPADGSVRSAPIVQPIKGHTEKFAVFIVSTQGTVFAVGAESGKLLWKVRPGEDRNGVTGSPAYADGRLYIPFTGSETLAGADPKYECCRSRGAVAALDANSGKTVWIAQSIQEPLISRGKNELGTPLWGPAGAGIWSSPTIDRKRGVLYVGTGNGFTEPAARTSDSILAIDLRNGRIRWHYQLIAGDAFVLGCPDESPKGKHCPSKLGPDWDLGGSSIILQKLSNGKEILLAAGKAGIAIGVNPDTGKEVWRTRLWTANPPTEDGLVIFGGAADSRRVYYPLQQPGGGLTALDVATGGIVWRAAVRGDGRGQVGPATAITGLVFTGGWDGVWSAVDTRGKVVWRFDSNRTFRTINGVEAKGGSIGSAGATVANGNVYLVSGYVGMQQGKPGNVLMAFSAR